MNMQINWNKLLEKQYSKHPSNSSLMHTDAFNFFCFCFKINMARKRPSTNYKSEKKKMLIGFF